MDDGAESFEQSVAMVRLAASSGTTDIVATPHSNLEYKFLPDLIDERIGALEQAVGPAPRIHRGCDFHLSFDNVQDAIEHPGKYTIDHRCYLLVEFSDLTIFHTTTEIFERLMGAGMIPVITHPERNGLLQQKIKELREWVEMGCLLQVTAQSVLGRFGSRAREFSETLLAEGLVHVLASDAHDTEHRPPRLDEARAAVAESFNEELAEALTRGNPGMILEGKRLPPMPAKRSRKKWYRFW